MQRFNKYHFISDLKDSIGDFWMNLLLKIIKIYMKKCINSLMNKYNMK